MTTASKATREIMERFNSAFEKHRPEDLDDLIGEGCVLENTGARSGWRALRRT